MSHMILGKIASFMVAMVICLGFAALLLIFASHRPTTYQYFDEALPPEPSSIQTMVWQDAEQSLDRPFLAAEKTLIGQRLHDGWTAHSIGLETQRVDHLSDHFSGPALQRARAASTVSGARMTVLEQVVQPSFYHSDGSLVALDSDRLTARFVVDPASHELQSFDLVEDQTVSMVMNESTGWKIYAHERQGLRRVSWHANDRNLQQHVPRLAGINYYPAQTPWRRFWPAYNTDIIAADFDHIRSLGANAIRIFLQRDAFINPDIRDDHLARLEELLNLAHDRGLWVVPTLFDLRGGYETAHWAHDHLFLRNVLPVIVACNCTAYVDLKNEPDLDYDNHGRGLVQAWLLAMAGSSRQIAPELRFTVGWAEADHAADLAYAMDVITYHEYAPLHGSAERLADVQRLAAGKPVHVTEIGVSSWTASARFPGSPKAQARELAARTAALKAADGLFVWTLHDFPDPDPDYSVLGSSPWNRALQSRFGLIALDGTEKPAADIIRTAFPHFLGGTPE